MKRTILAALLVLAAIIGVSCRPRDITSDFVSFDQDFIPLVSAVSSGNAAQAASGMRVIRESWKDFARRNYDFAPSDPRWNSDLAEIDRSLNRADTLVSSNQLPEANIILTSVRVTLNELRQRNRIEYFLDNLDAFRTPMEMIVRVVRNATPENLTETQIDTLTRLGAQARVLWDTVRAAKFNPAAFHFTKRMSTELAACIRNESDFIQQLNQALARRDRAAIIRTGLALKPVFDQAYHLFGRFEKDKP